MDVHTWIFGEDLDRERMLDMDERLAPVRRNALVVLGVALLLSSPWVGAWTLAPLFLAAVLFKLANRQVGQWRRPGCPTIEFANRTLQLKRPEYPVFGAWVASEVIIAAAIALAGGPRMVTMGWFVIPIVTLPSRFSARVVKLGAAIALVLLAAVAFGTDAGAVISDPPLVIGPAATIIAVAMLLIALMRSDIEHRDECVIDQLTGLLNRKALATRSGELEQQAAVTGEPVGVIACDLDHFKALNDERGHAAGDAALSQVAYRLRKKLRAFDLVYRLGGEEFLILVPGADLEETSSVAEALCEAVASEPLSDGSNVTMSLGVSASIRGQQFDFDAVARRADEAMYDAKRAGRNRVCLAASAAHDALAVRAHRTSDAQPAVA
jgi:diguanylate cyclase (GGDEF)-like protein